MANVTDLELDIRLQELAEGLGLSVYEFVTGGFVNLETYQLNLAAINTRLDAIDVLNGSDGVETVVERLETLRNLFETTDGDLITTVIADIAANKTSITAEVAARTAADAVLDGKVVAVDAKVAVLDAKVEAEKTRVSGLVTGLEGRVAAEEAKSVTFGSDLAVLKGDATVAGSVANLVKGEADRSKAVDGNLADLTTTVKTNLVAAINEVKAGIAAGTVYADQVKSELQTLISVVDGKATIAQAEIDAIEAAIGLSETGTFTPIDGSDSLLEYIKNTDGDANTVIKALKKLAKSAKAADAVLDAKIVAEKARAEGIEAGLQSQINTLSGGNTTSIADLTGRVTAVESTLNDKTVDGNLVKGITHRVGDLEAGLTAAVTAIENAKTAGVDKAYTDDKFLGVPQIQNLDICAAVNKFRAKLFLAPKVCDGSTTPVDQGQGGGL